MKRRSSGRSWDATRLRAWVDRVYGGESLVVLSDRHPVQREGAPGDQHGMTPPSGGLVTALEPLTETCKLLWVARSTGAPLNIVNRRNGPYGLPTDSRLRLCHVSLTPQEEQGYYYGFSKNGLWPLCHRTVVRPTFQEDDFRMYGLANARFVDVACHEVSTRSPIILVQDYHFALAPKMIRARLPSATVVAFWHIPFPSPRVLGSCPWERQLLEGLLGSSIVAFQTADDCQNFLDAVECVLDARVDRDDNTVAYAGHHTLIRAYPASVEWPNQWVAQSSSVQICRGRVRRRFGMAPQTQLIVGIDRLDYTKGLTHKLLALEQLLVTHPECRGNVVLVQVAEPSRSCLPAYQEHRTRLLQTADRINRRFSTNGYAPIVLLERHVDKREVFELFRAGDVCYVGSLHDGMNLVSKEFVSARNDERGVLVLSEFAGAACELKAALRINPYAIQDCATTLAEALTMPIHEQSRRMRSMRTIVKRFNSYRWARDILAEAASVRTHAGDPFTRVRRNGDMPTPALA